MKRSGFQKLDYKAALKKALARRKATESLPRNGRPERARRIGAGRRMKEWRRVWAWLKPRLEAAGRTHCEFDFIIHECEGPLDPCHSKKRREMEGDDIYAVALGCRKVHRILDEKYDHETMEVAVMHAINRHGGMITPAMEAAKKAA